MPDLSEVAWSIARLRDAVADAVTAAGWEVRDLGSATPAQLTLTRDTGGGVLATAELRLRPAKRIPGWPITVGVHLGGGCCTSR